MKKLITTIFTAVFSTVLAFSMPCFESFIPDTSGEFVYYQDRSFTRESYIGILYYDDSNLQVRYFAPQDDSQMLPEKNIEILVAVNPDSPVFEMTGERFLSSLTPDDEDTEIVNYLHDILYEFSSRRSKQVMISPTAAGYVSGKAFNENGIKIQDDFMQFGGDVIVQYDAIIPLFNIKNIYSPDGSKVLECVTIGQISSASDSTFNDFNGFVINEEIPAKKNKTKTTAKTVTYENQTLTVEDFSAQKWSQVLENFYTFGDDSTIALSTIPSISEEKFFNETFIVRKLLLSTASSFTNLSKTGIVYNAKKNQIKIDEENWQPANGKAIITKKIITKNEKNNGYAYFSLSVYAKPYYENRSYYEKIIKSYKAN